MQLNECIQQMQINKEWIEGLCKVNGLWGRCKSAEGCTATGINNDGIKITQQTSASRGRDSSVLLMLEHKEKLIGTVD